MSVTTHCISGFASVYIIASKLFTLKKKNLWISAAILISIEILAYIADILLKGSGYESNYMFLVRSAGTPFEICNKIVGGIQILYTLFVATLYMLVFVAYVGVTHIVRRSKGKIKA